MSLNFLVAIAQLISGVAMWLSFDFTDWITDCTKRISLREADLMWRAA
jgi:hypothetical protein